MESPAQTPPSFSVIMPVYNHAAYVAEAVRSVQGQTHPNWELIIVDDGSTDGSGEIVEALAREDRRITVLHQPNAGPAAARNAALARARADWLAFLDSDDLYRPDALEAYARYIAEHPEAKFIYGYRDRLNPDGSVTALRGEYQDRPTGTAELFERMYLSHLCVCYRRELIDQAGPYDPTLRRCEDYELYLRISLHCRFEPIGRATGLRRRHETNLSRQTGASRTLEADILRRFVEELGGKELIPPQTVRRRLGRLYYAAGRQYFKAGCFPEAREVLRISRSYQRSLKGRVLAGLCLLLARPRRDGRRRTLGGSDQAARSD